MNRAKTAAAAIGLVLWMGFGGCSKSTWQQIGDDGRRAMETTGQVIEGAAKGAIQAVEKD